MRYRIFCFALVLMGIMGFSSARVNASEWIITELVIDGISQKYYVLPVNLYINNHRIYQFGADMPPIILEDRLFLPVRDVFEILGGNVTWNDVVGQVFVFYQNRVISMRSDSTFVNVDGDLTELPLPPRTVNGRLMIPASFFADVFGFETDWVSASRTFLLDSGRELDFFAAHTEPDPDTVIGPQANDVPVAPNELTPVAAIVDHHHDQAQNITLPDENVAVGPAHLELSIEVDPQPIPAISAPQTQIIAVDFPADNPHIFHIRAAGPISSVERFLLYDNRLVVDVYNARKLLDVHDIHVGSSSVLQRIRVGESIIGDEIVTRVVFDLLEPVNYSVTLSEDRTTVTVSMHHNEITGVTFASDGTFDFVYIEGLLTPVVNIFPHRVPGSFVIEIPLGTIQTPLNIPVNGVFASNLRAEQTGPALVQVILDIQDPVVAHYVSFDGNTTIVRIGQPTHQNMSYDRTNRRLIIPKNPNMPIDINNIVLSDDYLNFEYVVVLPGDFSTLFGEGNYIIRDNYISHINVSTVNNRTSIRFFQQRVMAYTITESEHNIYINIMHPREKYDRIVIIDPGHGGADPGAIVGNLVEKDLNLDIALRLAGLLENNGIRTYLTRKTDVGPTSQERADFANDIGDIFVSIHLNAWYNSGPHGTETYYWPGYFDETAFITSARAAEIMQRNILASIGSRDRGTKQSQYRVLTMTTIPAVLIEFGFLTNPTEAARLASESYRQLCAEGAFRGIMEIFSRYTPRR